MMTRKKADVVIGTRSQISKMLRRQGMSEDAIRMYFLNIEALRHQKYLNTLNRVDGRNDIRSTIKIKKGYA